MLLLALALLHLGPAWAALTFEKAGWLDRMVAHHKKLFLEDVDQMPPEPIVASLAPKPAGYVDSPAWDFASVMRLVSLVHSSAAARPVRRAIRRALAPSRRLNAGGRNTFKLFPSLAKNHPNYFYYDASVEYLDDDAPPDGFNVSDDAIVVVSNPVEARLPSAQISIRLLKEIMESRALAARVMPSTTKQWKNLTKKTTTPVEAPAGGATGEPTSVGEGEGLSTDNSSTLQTGLSTDNASTLQTDTEAPTEASSLAPES